MIFNGRWKEINRNDFEESRGVCRVRGWPKIGFVTTGSLRESRVLSRYGSRSASRISDKAIENSLEAGKRTRPARLPEVPSLKFTLSRWRAQAAVRTLKRLKLRTRSDVDLKEGEWILGVKKKLSHCRKRDNAVTSSLTSSRIANGIRLRREGRKEMKTNRVRMLNRLLTFIIVIWKTDRVRMIWHTHCFCTLIFAHTYTHNKCEM